MSFVTVDVFSLYPSVPHEDGLNALSYYLVQRSDLHPPRELLFFFFFNRYIVLIENDFRFQDHYYHYQLLLKHFKKNKKNRWRYSDDLFLVWSDDAEDPKKCYEYLNIIINFTSNYDSNRVSLSELCKCKTSTMTVVLTWGSFIVAAL